ncbi:glycosyltransferase family 39 protein [Microbacterium sp. XT11]|uniref:glycosyltransferase family 39 protein n=1 Tax=Microbacterium sp. XT11 TaxID=367477 RepID=UPI0018DD0892|nr:glycosyltransferase family 39 protein [Microbacterium sp. XT11]
MVVIERRIDDVGPAAAPRRGRILHALRSHPGSVVGTAAALVSFIGAGVPSYWGDEAASVLSAQRPWPSLADELSTVDAVHGAYYALLHLWIDVFGAGEAATRALSAIGIGLLAGAVVVLGRRWFDMPTAVLAGAFLPLIPRAGVLAIEARGYALAAAAAAWITVLVVVLVERSSSRWHWWLYGAAVAASGTFFLYLLLMPAVHLAIALTARRARRHAAIRGWIRGVVVAGVLASPILLVAAGQRGQIAFLAHRGYMSPKGWFVTPWFGHLPAAVTLWLLLLVGVVVMAQRSRGARSGRAALAPVLTWLFFPALVTVAVDGLISPAYNPRYLSISLGAVALSVAVGVVGTFRAAARMQGRLAGLLVIVLVSVVVATTVAPEFVRARTPYAKDGGADGRPAAAVIDELASAGDTVLYGTGTRPSRAPRLVARLYPAAFVGLGDPQLVRPAEDTDGLWDVLAPVDDIAPALADGTVWLIETGDTGSAIDDLSALHAAGFTQVSRTVVHRTVIYEFQKESQP